MFVVWLAPMQRSSAAPSGTSGAKTLMAAARPMSRARRNRFVERWIGREWDLRRHQAEAFARIQSARKDGDVDEVPLSYGQDAGLIHDILPAGEIVRRIAEEAETILTKTMLSLVT